MTEATEANGGGNGHGADPLQKRVEEGPKGGAVTWYDVLEIAIDASAADVKKAYDRALALVEGRNIGGYLMLDPMAAESARADVEAAYQVLGDPERRASYDARLREQGKAPAAKGGNDATIPAHSARAGDEDDEAREAKELLAVAEAQTSSTSSKASTSSAVSSSASSSIPTGTSTIPAPTATTSGLKFLAPADEKEKSEKSNASPKRESVKEDPLESRPTLPAIRFGEPKTEDATPIEDVSDVFQTFKPQPAETSTPPAMRPSTTPQPHTPSASIATSPSTTPHPTTTATTPHPSTTPQPSAPATTATTGSFVASALPEGEITGQHIKELREGRSMSLDAMAEATKIRKQYLRAIEDQDFPNLPARVYLRGFLTQIARVLKVDRARLAEGYLQFVEKNGPKS